MVNEVELSETGHLSGVLGIFAIGVAFLLGAIVLYKAIKLKQKTLFYFFLTVFFTISPWYSSGFGYIFLLITKNHLDYRFYVLLGTIFIPIAIHGWLTIYMEVLFPQKKNFVLISYAIISIIFYIYLFLFLYFCPGAPMESMIGIKRNPIDIEYRGFVFIYLGLMIITAVLTGIHFSIISLKSDTIEVKWKGRFLLSAFILFGIGAIADGLSELSLLFLFIFRVILLVSASLFYIGFIMPKWMRKIIKI